MLESATNFIEKYVLLIFAVFSFMMLILEPFLEIINNAISTNFTRLYFYIILVPVYLYVYKKFIKKRGIDSSTFKIEQVKFKTLVSLGLVISFVTTSLLYTEKFVFLRATSKEAGPIGSFFPIGIINFQQYFFIYLIISAITIKVFGTDESFEIKYPNKITKISLSILLGLLFLMPAYLIKRTIAIFRGEDTLIIKIFSYYTNIDTNIDYRINLQFQSSINFIQHQILLIIAIMTFIITVQEELKEFLARNNKNKIGFFTIVVVYLFYDLVALTLSDNSPSNMLKQTEIIIFQASTLIMISAGLTLTTRVRKFGNFAHAEFVTVGLYVVILIKTTSVVEKFIGTSTNSFSIGSLDIPAIPIFGGNNIFGWMFFAFILTGIIGMIGELLVFAPLDRRKAVRLTLMVGSIGLGLIIRQSIQEYFGGQNQRAIDPVYPNFFAEFEKFLDTNFVIEFFTILGLMLGVIIAYRYLQTRLERAGAAIFGTSGGFIFGNLLGVLFTTEQFGTMSFGTIKLFHFEYHLFDEIVVIVPLNHLWALTVMILIVLFLRYIFVYTTLGISMRATADDDELAQITGINTRRVIYWTWFIAAGVTGIGALWRFEASNIIPSSGFLSLLIIFAVVILGGFDSFEGTLISALIIATFQNVSAIINRQLSVWQQESSDIDTLVFWNPNGDWTQVIPFAMIIVVLFVRPRGIFGVVDPKSKL